MTGAQIYAAGLVLLMVVACNQDNLTPNNEREIPEFDFPETVVFEQSLSAYNIFEG